MDRRLCVAWHVRHFVERTHRRCSPARTYAIQLGEEAFLVVDSVDCNKAETYRNSIDPD